MHLELHLGSGEGKKTAFKWNVSHFKGELLVEMEDRWKTISEDSTFFHKFRNVGRFYGQASKEKPW